MQRNIVFWLLATVFLATVSFAEAQQSKKVPRIVYFSASSAASQASRLEVFKQGLRDLGFSKVRSPLTCPWNSRSSSSLLSI